MKLRHLIERVGTAPSPRTVAIVATPATVDDGSTGRVATVASIAAPPDPKRWPNVLRALSVEGVDLRPAADALGQLVEVGVVAEALALGWDARDLVGLWRFPPHTLPSRAGLIFSLYPGDMVRSLRATGCVIAIGGGNLRHIWRRALVRDVVLPWALPAASPLRPEIWPPDSIRHPASPGVQTDQKSTPTAKYGLSVRGGGDGE